MIIELTLERDKQNKKILAKQAAYNPSQSVKDRTGQVMRDFQSANIIRNKPYAELNFLSLAQRISVDQQSYNQYPGLRSTDPAEAWRSLAFRPIVRNKIISIAAHITAAIIYPKIYAQNEQDNDDKDAATVMRSIMEWCNEQSGYEKTFLYSVISALVNPATVIHTEFAKRFREIKETKPDGTWVTKEVLDELFSGFQDSIVAIDELWIANMYEHDIQKQPYLIWRRVLDYSTARAKYGDNETFNKYVKPGVQFLYSDESNIFYEQYDKSLEDRLVEEVLYYNRSGDLQLAFVNGILLSDVDQPNPRKDKLYPFVKGGYELIDEGRFFYYKSLAYKLANDEEIVNTAYRMVVDGTYMQIMPPAVVFGDEEIGSSVIAPGVITTINNRDNPNAAFQTLNTNNNLSAGYNLIEKVESSISESSSDVLQSGQASGGGSQTAYEISKLDQNARVMLGLFGKMIGFMVKEFGTLRIGDILQFLTVGEAMEIENPSGRMKFHSFLLPEKTIDGKAKSQKIEFTEVLPDEGTDHEFMDISSSIKTEQRDLGDNMQIFKINPTLFRKMKFKCIITPEAISPKSDALIKALKLEEYGLAVANPLVNLEAITRDLLLGSFDETKDNADKYMKKPEEMAPQSPPSAAGSPQTGGQDIAGQMAQNEGTQNLKELAGVM